MLHFLKTISLLAITAFATVVLALPGGGGGPGGLSTAEPILEGRLPTPYVGVCFNNNKCDEGMEPGHSHDVAGDGKSNIKFAFKCISYLPVTGDGYACKQGCGMSKKGNCVKVTEGKCMNKGPYKYFCAKG